MFHIVKIVTKDGCLTEIPKCCVHGSHSLLKIHHILQKYYYSNKRLALNMEYDYTYHFDYKGKSVHCKLSHW